MIRVDFVLSSILCAQGMHRMQDCQKAVACFFRNSVFRLNCNLRAELTLFNENHNKKGDTIVSLKGCYSVIMASFNFQCWLFTMHNIGTKVTEH